jgi:hypothetical protein
LGVVWGRIGLLVAHIEGSIDFALT